MNTRRIIVWATLLFALPPLIGCQVGGARVARAPIAPPVGALDVATLPPPVPKADGTSVMVYVKVVIDKKYGVLAHLLGGKRDSTSQLVTYDAAKPWWSNPLIVYRESPLLVTDVVGRADAQVMTGHGASGNVAIKLTLIPHADVSVRTVPRTDGIKGTLTTTISASAEFYDGEWIEMARESDWKVTFSIDTCDPLTKMEAIGQETRTIPAFAFERHTRDHEKWEPRSAWPRMAESGDWRVVIYAREATLQLTRFRSVEESAIEAPQ